MFRMPPEDSEAFRLMGDPRQVVAALDPAKRGALLFTSEAVALAQATIESASPPRPTAIVVMCRALVRENGRLLAAQEMVAARQQSPLAIDVVLVLVGLSNYRVLHNFSRDPDGRKIDA